MNKAADLYNSNLWKHPSALNYLIKDRGIYIDTIKKYKIGYASDDLLVKAGIKDIRLINNNEDKFNGFITFPIIYNNEVVGMYGRNFKSPRNTIHLLSYNMSKDILYNMDGLKSNSVIIVESPIDALTLLQNDFNSVALFGISLKDQSIKYFKDKTCYILFDKDDAGKLGAEKVAGKLNGHCKTLYNLVFPGRYAWKEDANSYFMFHKHSSTNMRRIIRKAVPISESSFKYSVYKERIKIIEDEYDIVLIGKKLFNDWVDNGYGIWVRCPFHKEGTEKKRSLWIGGKKNIFYCFGCLIGGGPVRLVKWVLGLNFDEAREWIRDNFHLK